uniref:Uncharacterized sensor-like histidine kinase ycf26 n=1 Tax=Acrochaetium secundatum TaxID=209631 RepID=A0A4D6BKJ7_9FLOR|nr:Drug sensory protein A [Acrochaetium secundatum]QBX88524.1 Drug sensory protein A [Acrochaetium secundatum]
MTLSIMKIYRYLRQLFYYNTKVKLLACTILCISLIASGFTFLALLIIYKSNTIHSLNTIHDIFQLVSIDNHYFNHYECSQNVTEVIESLYLSLPNLKYLLVVDNMGLINYVLPENLIIDLQAFPNDYILPELNFIDQSLFNDSFLYFILPLGQSKLASTYLYIGITHDYRIINNIIFFYAIISIFFIIIWLTSTLTILINSSINKSSIQLLSKGMDSIMSGNFKERVILQNNSVLHGLMFEFNEMAERLEYYEKKNIQQLILEKAKLETLVSIIADGALLLDKDLRIIFINKSALQTFTFLQSCMIGAYISDYLPNYINKQLLPILNHIVQSSYNYNKTISSQSSQFSINLNDDISKTFQFIITTVLDNEHHIITGIGIVIKDITSQIGLNEAKSQFISNVSHELRTPLFNIRSFLETLSEYRNSLSEKQQVEFLDIASQETQRLTHLVNDVLDLSRLESDFIDSMEMIELHDVVPSILQTSQIRASQKYLHLTLKISRDILPISGYNHLLIQVFSNLIGNSLKFTSVDGRIVVKIYPISLISHNSIYRITKIRVEILDEGSGIQKFDQSRIYDRFVRLENNVHTIEGTGLGLSIVKNIISKHQSKILLYSEFGIGSSFWFDLELREKKN